MMLSMHMMEVEVDKFSSEAIIGKEVALRADIIRATLRCRGLLLDQSRLPSEEEVLG